jgi:hypothetical protein
VLQGEGDVAACKRDAPEGLVAVAELGRLGAQELAPRRRIEIEVGHRYRRARRARRRRHFPHAAGLCRDERAVGSGLRAARDRKPRYRGDGGERLAPESHRGDALQVAEVANLARGVPREGKGELLARDACAVVVHLHAPHAAFFERHRDGAGAGVDAVLDQLLQDGSRALHNLAGGDLAHQQIRQHLDAVHSERSASWPPVMRRRSG